MRQNYFRKRWRTFSYLFLLLFLLFICSFQFQTANFSNVQLFRRLPPIQYHSRDEFNSTDDGGQPCKIPELDPFDSSIKHLITTPNVSCPLTKPIPHYFNSTLESDLIPAIPLEKFKANNVLACCYRVIKRAPSKGDPDAGYKFGRCHPVSLENRTRVPPGHEFIAVFCGKVSIYTEPNIRDFVDLFAFVHLKPSVEKRLVQIDAKGPSPSKVNVVIFGLDAVSRANFVRSMPKSYAYLTEDMNAIEMRGYVKVGGGTPHNLVPMLAGLPLDLTKELFLEGKSVDFSPYLWKDFSEKGYVTGFADDSYECPIFSKYYSDFTTQPTDYYFRPLVLAAGDYYKKYYENCTNCSGPVLHFEKLIDYFKRLMHKMTEEMKSMFLLFWEGSVTHDDMNGCQDADVPVRNTLQWLHEGRYLNNTVFILMSDHGSNYGPIMNYRQGQIEDRMPFVFFVLPEDFKQNYKRAVANLRSNERRLVTSLDLHYTLKDLLDQDGMISDWEIEFRENELTEILKNVETIPTGISLFLPIPSTRECEDTIIEASECLCRPFHPVPTGANMVESAAKWVINTLNERLNKTADEKCAHLKLIGITMAQKRSMTKNDVFKINFKTKPGDGEFEATVENTQDPDFFRFNPAWKLLGDVARTNRYGNQSWCVDSPDLKPICLCN